MRVDMEYTAPATIATPIGPLEFPAGLDFWLRWETAVDLDAPGTTTIFRVAQGVEVELTTAAPIRLMAVMITDGPLVAWDLVEKLVGPELVVEGQRVLADEITSHQVNVDDEPLLALEPVWKTLLEVTAAGVLRVLPRTRGQQHREFEAVVSDPRFFERGVKVLVGLYGEEAVRRALDNHSGTEPAE